MTGVNVITGMEAFKVDNKAKTVAAKNVDTGEIIAYPYDKLVIAVGASPVVPPIKGIDKQGVFKLRVPDDAVSMRDYLQNNAVKKPSLSAAALSVWKRQKTCRHRVLMLPLLTLPTRLCRM